MRTRTLAAVLLLAATCAAQRADSFAREAKQYVKYDDPIIILQHVRVIDGTGAAPLEDQTITIRDGKIVGIVRSVASANSEVTTPHPPRTLDLAGYTVIPGIVGMHEHLYYPAPGRGGLAMYPEHASSFPKLYLAGGVTTARTTGSIETYTDLEIKKLIDSGKLAGPSLNVTGPYLEGRGSFTPQMHELKDAADARRTVDYWMDEGVGSFKAYMNITRDELRASIEQAHKRNIKVTGHLCSITFREAADLGIDDLEHGLVVDSEFYAEKKPDECPPQGKIRQSLEKLDPRTGPLAASIRYLVDHHVAITSTLPVFETFVPGRGPLDDRVLTAMSPQSREEYLLTRSQIGGGASRSAWPQMFKLEMDFEREFVRQGGTLLAGLDPTGYGGVIAGYGDQREIELLVEAGFTPVEAIHIATSNGAAFLGLLDRIGTLAPGKQADIVLIHGDPSANIADIEKVELVFKDGIAFDSAKLQESVRGQVGIR